MKKDRQQAIIDIIQHCSVETQEELIQKLAERGFNSTQATVSRDIRELRIVKTSDGTGGYRYSCVRDSAPNNLSDRLELILREGCRSVDFVNNIVFIHTLPGLAPAVASALDNMHQAEMLGSVSGDDSVMIIMRDNHSAGSFAETIRARL